MTRFVIEGSIVAAVSHNSFRIRGRIVANPPFWSTLFSLLNGFQTLSTGPLAEIPSTSA